MSEKKKSHGVQLLLRMVVKDPDGKILSDTGQKPSKSFLIQFLEFIYYNFWTTGIGERKATDTSGAENSIMEANIECYKTLNLAAPINNSLYGLVIGTGDTAETNTDYKLETQLTEGVGAGNITHGAVTVENAGIVDANVDLVVKRSFPNNTGSTITVKEAGAYVGLIVVAIQYYHCIIRDVLGTPIDIPDKCSLTVYYTFRTTVTV